MQVERVVRTFAGSVVLVSLALGHFVAPGWYWLTAFVGANLFQSGLTGFCLLATILRRLQKPAPAAGR
jgi:Inner membrane protein YgaP-like, transmembrane domain